MWGNSNSPTQLVGGQISATMLGNWHYLVQLNIYVLYDPVLPLLDIYPI